MLRFFPLLLIFEAICVFHAYRNKADQKWFWLILFFPLIGGIIYLFDFYYNRENIDAVSEGVKEMINPNHKTDQLKKNANFSGSILNRTKLADRHMEQQNFQEAIDLYESCLEGFNSSDYSINLKLLHCYFSIADYSNAVKKGEILDADNKLTNSNAKIAYAWAFYELGRFEDSELTFKSMDHTYTNYEHRYEYAKFLQKQGRTEDSLKKLTQLRNEFDDMTSSELRQFRQIRSEINNLYHAYK